MQISFEALGFITFTLKGRDPAIFFLEFLIFMQLWGELQLNKSSLSLSHMCMTGRRVKVLFGLMSHQICMRDIY